MKNALVLILLLLGAAVLMYGAYAVYENYTTNYDQADSELPANFVILEKEGVGPESMDFELEDMNGDMVKLSDYKGKIVFLNFWASWCGPCKQEMPDIQKAHEEISKGDDAVWIAVDLADGYNGETVEVGKKFINDNNYTFKVLFDTEGTAAREYQVNSIPVTYVIKEDGTIFGLNSGPIEKQTILDIVEMLK